MGHLSSRCHNRTKIGTDVTRATAVREEEARFARHRHAIDHGTPPRVSVIVVDEASMADVVSVQRIATWCTDTGKRVVLQGDPAQLGAVAAGDAFSVLCNAYPEQVLSLTTNMRQRTDDGQAIARALHSGDVATAWTRLGDTGAVLVARNREHKLTLLAGLVTDQIATHGPVRSPATRSPTPRSTNSTNASTTASWIAAWSTPRPCAPTGHRQATCAWAKAR
jgi:hypothetical protein